MTPEGKVKAKVDKLLKSYPEVWYYSPQAGPYGSAGIPDRVAIVDGRFIGIEVKSGPTKKPTRLQEKCMRDIEAAGGRCFVICDETGLEELRLYLEGMEIISVRLKER